MVSTILSVGFIYLHHCSVPDYQGYPHGLKRSVESLSQVVLYRMLL